MNKTKVLSVLVLDKFTWMDDIIVYLLHCNLLKDKAKEQKLVNYIMIRRELYKRNYSMPYLLCLDDDETHYMLRKIHEDICSNHTSEESLKHKVIQ